MLKNNALQAKAIGDKHWLQFLPDHVYCFLPSFDGNAGTVEVYGYMPEFVKDVLYCMEIKQVK